MVQIEVTGVDQGAFDREQAILATLSDRFRDAGFRHRLETNGAATLREMGFQVPPGVEVKVVQNTASLIHFVLPPDPNSELTDEALSVAAGGSTVGTAGSAGTVGTLSSVPSSWSSVSTATTAGTAASGN